MTEAQEQHLKRMQTRIAGIIAAKYRTGAEEHGGNLWDSPILLQEAIAEVADLATYLLTLEEAQGTVRISQNPEVQVLWPPNREPTQCPILKPHHKGDVGYDLVVTEHTILEPLPSQEGFSTNVPCKVQIKIPEGYYAQIVGRSSTAHKRGILVHTATIDNGYTGELFACCWNMGSEQKIVRAGERIAQIIFLPLFTPELKLVDELALTERNERGFGSTGK
jgi:dUTP pyrophosphatase